MFFHTDILQLKTKLSKVLQNAVTGDIFTDVRDKAVNILVEMEKKYQSMTKSAKALKCSK